MITHDKTQKIFKILLQKYNYVVYKVVHHHFQMRYNVFITRIEAPDTRDEIFKYFLLFLTISSFCVSLNFFRALGEWIIYDVYKRVLLHHRKVGSPWCWIKYFPYAFKRTPGVCAPPRLYSVLPKRTVLISKRGLLIILDMKSYVFSCFCPSINFDDRPCLSWLRPMINLLCRYRSNSQFRII